MVEPIRVERDTVDRLYRLDRAAHVVADINDKVALLGNHWFKVDEPMISAFVERWLRSRIRFICRLGSARSLCRMWLISLAFR
ncbi:hypothetical protein PIB30_081127 [Stylosanthes scabra]|uniref:Uncharacterized protein n=1 Tax=Stylosanthes scabra TaxID=79078 RepID=A0ABU6TS91_9FABA|nr:hypothetical protein [Stylosanthes scabra]